MTSSAAAKKPRPKYLSLTALLFEIRMPVMAWVSGMHRISGALLFLPLTAWLLYLLDLSLGSEAGFEHARRYLSHPLAKLGIVVFAWAMAHHFFCGIRFLLIDIDKGVDARSSRASAYAVFAASFALTALVAWRLW